MTEYRRDSSGRLLAKSSKDGRLDEFTYDEAKSGNISSIKVYPHGPEQAFESLVRFTWDHQGRLQSRELTLANGESYMTTISYDWQDRIVRKTLPDQSVVRHDYRGSLLVSSSLSSGDSTAWSLNATTSKFSNFVRATETKISGTNIEELCHTLEYDVQGFPIKHGLETDRATMVQASYFYNDLDQMTRTYEYMHDTTTEYNYQGRRLAASQRDGARSTYEYDVAGNIVKNRDLAVKFSPDEVMGSKSTGETAFRVTYDGVGRMCERVTGDSTLQFGYDAFGSLQSIKDSRDMFNTAYTSDFEGKTLERKHSDGTGDLFVSDEYTVHTNSNGTRTIGHKLFSSQEHDGSAHLLGTVSTTHKLPDASQPFGEDYAIRTYFADTKGNMTHIFGLDLSVISHFKYDDFGAPHTRNTNASSEETAATYEGNYLECDAGLINFGGRWEVTPIDIAHVRHTLTTYSTFRYDPLVGRFITPDNILEIGYLARTDGLNRYAFENNDPINHVDPTGHWSWSSILGVIIGVVFVVAAIAVTVATGVAAAPLLALVVGALAGRGVAGITYSVKHQDETDTKKSWAGFGTTVAIQAGIGAVPGFAGAFVGPASSIAGVVGRVALKAVIGSTSSVTTKLCERGVENTFYGKHENLFDGLVQTFALGAVVGGLPGAVGNKLGASKAVLSPGMTNVWLVLAKKVAIDNGKAVLTQGGGKLAGSGANEFGLPDKIADISGKAFTELAKCEGHGTKLYLK